MTDVNITRQNIVRDTYLEAAREGCNPWAAVVAALDAHDAAQARGRVIPADADRAARRAIAHRRRCFGFDTSNDVCVKTGVCDCLADSSSAVAAAASLLAPRAPVPNKDTTMTEDQVKYMVDRFLCWQLPDNFAPDGGITFQPIGNESTAYQYRRVPCGTNLLNAVQADAMVRYMLDGVPASAAPRAPVTEVTNEMDRAACEELRRQQEEHPKTIWTRPIIEAALSAAPRQPEHASDCALHNAPALPPGPCNCRTAADREIAEAAMSEDVTITIVGKDRRFIAPVLRELAQRAAHLTVLNPEHPKVKRMIVDRRKRLLALADKVDSAP